MRLSRNRRPALVLLVSALQLTALAAASIAYAQTEDRVIDFPVDQEANIQLVRDFCASWSTMDLSQVTAFLSNESVSRITMDLEPLTGPQAVIHEMTQWIESSSSIDFEILDIYARGPMVITHRIDTFASTTRPVTWEGVGVFRIEDGKIVEWSDHTIRVTIPATE